MSYPLPSSHSIILHVFATKYQSIRSEHLFYLKITLLYSKNKPFTPLFNKILKYNSENHAYQIMFPCFLTFGNLDMGQAHPDTLP